jgi:hypothetical protein
LKFIFILGSSSFCAHWMLETFMDRPNESRHRCSPLSPWLWLPESKWRRNG